MRQRAPFVHYIVLALALVFVAGTPTRAHADDRTEARTHYQAGVKFYNGGDYKAAIREFSAAQQLVPADLNNYNLALCYDKLGDAEPAVQYYRAYLDKIPNTDKRSEIEASIARLDAAAKSAAAKKAEEARKADEAKKAAEAKRAAEEAKAMAAAAKSEEEARKAEEARRANEAKRPPVDGSTLGDKPPIDNAGAGSSGTPGTGIVSTGDAQLDRAQAIDINAIRDQRLGGAGSGMVDRRGGPATAPAGAVGAVSTGAGAGTPPPPPPPPGSTASAQGPKSGPTDQHDQKKADPVYKKWWFWAVVAVSAYVVYSIATDNSSSSGAQAKEVLPLGPVSTANQAGGYTLLRW
jgi:hypothetical protein